MPKSILVINCGSSSLKFALIEPARQTTLLAGLAEKLGMADASMTIKADGGKTSQSLHGGSHAQAMEAILAELDRRELTGQVFAVGHRVVHGGDHFNASCLIDTEVESAIQGCVRLAPLHNPANLVGIRAARACLPSLPHVAVFDTAFHQTMPARAYLYAVPMSLYEKHAVRRYGFHGTSHRFVVQEAARLLGVDLADSGFVSAHLGNGASACAIVNGQSVDTTMGLTPLEGLVMGTRSGDIDPGLLTFIGDAVGASVPEVLDMLNKRSGLLGLSGLSNDMRELTEAAEQGHAGAQIAIEVFVHRLAKYIAAMITSLPKLDGVIFTGGIGENSAVIREKTLARLALLGFKLDSEANARCVRGEQGVITVAGSPRALVVDTNEELMIALDTLALVGGA